MTELIKNNNLQNEKSIYLVQHAKNPVNWFPYGPEALQKAKDEDKPIFLSIGHSSCHWCHVMSEESFTDLPTAEILNENFVCIKVDREELPDIDQYYQLACQIMNGRGGWPLSAFLTPNMQPFFIGTYFPKAGTQEVPSFLEVLGHIQKDFKENRETINTNAAKITETLNQPPTVEHKVDFEGHYPTAASIINAMKNFQDDDFGGYGSEPKFPQYSFLEWGVEHILEGMVPEELGGHLIKTIEQFMIGGLYDHAKGGVHRYCTEKTWTIPHFEKMLYDQAGLLKLLSKVSLIFPSPVVYDGLIQTLDYLQREMCSEQGFFFSAQDSDSEGMEGLYFTFSKDEFIDACVQHDEKLADKMDQILEWFNITEKGNFERQLNIIRLNPNKKEEIFSQEGWTTVRAVRVALSEARKYRIPPVTDTKGVASWNFFLLSSLIDVIQYCKIEPIKNAAFELYQKSYQNITDTFIQRNENGKTRIKGTTTRDYHIPLLEDYVAFADFCFRSYEMFGDSNFLENGDQSIHYIFKEFYKDGIFYTRALEFMDTEEYGNIHTPIFDQSYRSSLGLLIGLLRKWQNHFDDYKEFLVTMDSTLHSLTHLSLQSPLSFGETLRAFTYPDIAYKKVEIPLSWKKDPKFQQFYLNFSFRFALVYHQEENENWQIKNINEVELKGTGLEEFSKIFAPPTEKSE